MQNYDTNRPTFPPRTHRSLRPDRTARALQPTLSRAEIRHIVAEVLG
jgi:hypothetical protein